MSGRKVSDRTSASVADTPSSFSACVSFGLKRYFMQHVAAVEDLHHLGDPRGALAPLLLRERARERVRDNRQRVAAQARGSRGSSPAPSRAGPARPGSAPGRRASRSRSCSSFAWFCRSTSWLWSLGRLEDREQPPALCLGELHELVRVANVVLHVALLAGVEAALERQHEQDQNSRMAPTAAMVRRTNRVCRSVEGPRGGRRVGRRTGSSGSSRKDRRIAPSAVRAWCARRWEYERGAGRALRKPNTEVA